MSTVPNNFGDIINIVADRAKIASERQVRDVEVVKGFINEYYMSISTERSWSWRNFDRSIVFKKLIDTGTVGVTNGSREVVFTGLALEEIYRGRSLKFDNRLGLYRIIGVDTNTNVAVLEAPYVGPTNAAATFQMFQYEFPLPPDCDDVNMIYTYGGLYGGNGSNSGELDPLGRLRFNRILSNTTSVIGPAWGYTIDGEYPMDSLPPLDVMVLDYDFLGGSPSSVVKRLRVLSIAPNEDIVLNINYSRHVEPMIDDTDIPLMPIDDRWILVHFALGEWFARNNHLADSKYSFDKGAARLAEMRQEYRGTDQKPKLIFDARRYKRVRNLSNYKFMHLISRAGE